MWNIFIILISLIKKTLLTYSSKLSISKRSSMSVTLNVLCILPCSVNLRFTTLLVKEPCIVNLPGNLELSAFIHELLVLMSPNVVYQGKITSTQPNNNDKVNFRVLKKSFQDSTNTSNPLPVKITRMIQNCWKNTWKLSGKTLLQK